MFLYEGDSIAAALDALEAGMPIFHQHRPRMRRVDAVIFDLYALVDAESVSCAVWEQIASEEDIVFSGFQQMIGTSNRRRLAEIIRCLGLRRDPEVLFARFSQLFAERAPTLLAWRSGAERLFALFKRQGAGMPRGLIAGIDKVHLAHVLLLFGPKGFQETVAGDQEVEGWKTPRDLPYTYCASLLKVGAPPNTIAVAGCPIAVRAAVQAGMFVIALADVHEAASLLDAHIVLHGEEDVRGFSLAMLVGS